MVCSYVNDLNYFLFNPIEIIMLTSIQFLSGFWRSYFGIVNAHQSDGGEFMSYTSSSESRLATMRFLLQMLTKSLVNYHFIQPASKTYQSL